MGLETDVAVAAVDLTKRYPSGQSEITVLDRFALRVARGESVAITGPSGAGKTTLLYLLGGLDRPTQGKVFLGSTEMTALDADALARLRNREIGYVWQQNSLLPEFTARENVEMPLRIRGLTLSETARRADQSLEEVGLSGRGHHRAGELSGGEQQRVALARALAAEPALLLADEPTGNLDAATGERIIELLRDLQSRRKFTSVIVTHNPAFAVRCDRVVTLAAASSGEPQFQQRSYNER